MVNQRPLNEIVAEAVERALHDGSPQDPDALTPRVLENPDVKIILDGYEMHDRSEGYEEVMVRDIRRMVEMALQEHKSAG